MKTFVLITLLLSSGLSFAEQKGIQDLLPEYLKIQEQLANDSMDGINENALKISKGTSDKTLATVARELSRDTKLKSARIHFNKLSAVFSLWAKANNPSGVQRVHCDMAEADWVQAVGAIKNPYYGKSMQECGEIIK